MRKWVLPDQVEDVLPPLAGVIEATRRGLVDALTDAGYELVSPPLVEHLEALLTGTGHDLEAATFKLIDPLSGKLLGVRPDITPQIARIDATYFDDDGVRRFCYAGTVLRAHAAPGEARALTQVGAELFGQAGPAGDAEIVRLMIESARRVNAAPLLIDFGHVGLFKALAGHFGLSEATRSALDAALAAKSSSAIASLPGLPENARAVFGRLTRAFGEPEATLRAARGFLPDLPAVREALEDLGRIVSVAREAGARVSVDLADLPGLDYHTGLVFVAYLDGTTEVVARGGRYDGVGEAFLANDAPARPATGFSFIDLRALAAMTQAL
jgi:ATP phosphoribosyltransferase regulatory subunit